MSLGNGHREGSARARPDGDAERLADLRRQARAQARVDPSDEERLLHQSALGDRASQERLVAANMDMVIRLATHREDKGLSVLDLIQEGSIGLLQAVRSYATSGEAGFAAFAERRVGEQMDAAIESEAAAVRDAQLLVAAATDYERTELILRRELRREPRVDEIAEKLEWAVDRARYVGEVVADARRRHDEEVLAFIDPEAIDFDDTDERPDDDA